MENIRDSSCGKMCPEHSRQTAAGTSKPSLKASAPSKKIKLIFLDMRNGRMPEKSWQTIIQSHGGFSMLNTGEFPNEENASTLSQILEAGVPDYERFGRGAPLKRNITIIEHADIVLAFWDGKSRGTKFVIDNCHRRNIPIKIYLAPDFVQMAE